jgi:hypothetical protein
MMQLQNAVCRVHIDVIARIFHVPTRRQNAALQLATKDYDALHELFKVSKMDVTTQQQRVISKLTHPLDAALHVFVG